MTEENKVPPIACKTPIKDLRRMALEHYEQASNSIHHWMLVIPTAINEYYDSLEEADKRNDAILNDNGCLLQPGTPVQDNSHAFEEWLRGQGIEYRNSGHQTIILGNRDMFEIGRAWGAYKEINKPKNNQ